MKKVIFMAIFMLSAAAASAQMSFTARAGANVSGIENSDAKMKLGWKVGAGVDYSFSKLFSIRPMLYYTTKGCGSDKSSTGIFSDKALKLNYLELPVSASFHFGLGSNTSLVANVSPYVGCRINKSPAKSDFDYKKFDAGVGAGLDFVYKKMLIGVEAQYGMTSIAKMPNGNLRNINYSLVLGYNF